MNKRLLSIAGIVICLVLFIAANIAGARLFRGARLDLTESHLYTLSKGSRSIASKIDEPITLTLYISEKQANDIPDIKAYSTRVREFLQEYANASGGKIKFQVVDPEPFSEAEDRANAAGLYGAQTGKPGQERLYFGLVALNSTDKQEIIPFFDSRKEEFLEYDITRLIYVLSNPQKKTLGILASLPINGVQDNPLMRGQNTPPWQIAAQLKELFEVKNIPADAGEIPDDVKLLMVVHPKGLSDKTQFAIDQFVLKGGRLMVFVDPLCEADIPPGINPVQAMSIPKSSNLPKLFSAWGIEMTPERFAADRGTALRVTVGSQQRPEPVDYLAWLQLSKAKGCLSQIDSATAGLEIINVGVAGILTKKPDATIKFEPLLQTTANSEPMAIQQMPDPKVLLNDFQSGGKPLTIAARLSGKVKTAFPAGDPAKPATAEGQPPAPDTSLKESTGDAEIIVVADCDMLTDRFWITESRLGNILLGYQKLADNGEFIIGAADNLSGPSDLISLRARGKFYRPFTRVEEIRKQAEDKYLAEEKKLRDELASTQKKIDQILQAAAPGSSVILTPEQQAEIDASRKTMVETKKRLRDVNHQLRKDIEALGSKLKIINIGLMPIVVGLLAIGLSMYRNNRKRSVSKSASSLS